jgi:hypothetical protein
MKEQSHGVFARFDINERLGSPLDGRVYVSDANFESVYHGDLVYAVQRLREAVESPGLGGARKSRFKFTTAIMWGNSEGSEVIDFFGWKYNGWLKSEEITPWQTSDGLLVLESELTFPGFYDGDKDILRLEKEYRNRTDHKTFRNYGPSNADLFGLKPELDFCDPEGRRRLRYLMTREGCVA